ncbi:Aste57867_15153 [Aphanomyces stellatus]|uniref:Aste57867_15153 protein n=1 Tax=Aphanomyces stellatus TaxID=120398 RepID=A0A485L3R8_9STRA|nr:hypothetical protein As57867_015097 [Aphanomyces stellatus]VFT91962.1 Aste57867_15153 [Aphanomyces stellatus]
MMSDSVHPDSPKEVQTPDDYGTSQGFFSFASQLGRQLTQDAMDLSNSAVETAKYLAQESTKVVEKASLIAQESLAEVFEPESDAPEADIILELPWVDSDGKANKAVQEAVLDISAKASNFKQLPLSVLAPIFDIDRFVQVAPALLALDGQLRQRHAQLSYKVAEEVFWGNYFYHCHVARVAHGLSPYLNTTGVAVTSSPSTNQEHDDDEDDDVVSMRHELEDSYDVEGEVPAVPPTPPPSMEHNDDDAALDEAVDNQGDEPSEEKKRSTFTAMKSNLMQRSTQAKQKMADIKRKIHFPSPEKMKELQTSLLRRKSSVTESFERLSVTSLNFTGLKRSPSLRNRSKSYAHHHSSLPILPPLSRWWIRRSASNCASDVDDLDTVRLSDQLGTPPPQSTSATFDEE